MNIKMFVHYCIKEAFINQVNSNPTKDLQIPPEYEREIAIECNHNYFKDQITIMPRQKHQNTS